jgi:hypothetical protein
VSRNVTTPVWRVLSKHVATAVSKGITGSVDPRTVVLHHC